MNRTNFLKVDSLSTGGIPRGRVRAWAPNATSVGVPDKGGLLSSALGKIKRQVVDSTIPTQKVSLILLCILLSFGLAAPTVAQSESQEQVAQGFIKALFQEHYSVALRLLSPEAQATTSTDNLKAVAKPLLELSSQFGPDVLLFTKGVRTLQTGQTVLIYSYQFRGDVQKGFPSVLMDVGFPDAQSQPIGGFMPKFNARPTAPSSPISTYTGKELSLASEQEWSIAGTTIKVHEMALVMDEVRALLAIKVWDDSTSRLTPEQARRKAIPIVQYALAHGFWPAAKKGAEGANR